MFLLILAVPVILCFSIKLPPLLSFRYLLFSFFQLCTGGLVRSDSLAVYRM